MGIFGLGGSGMAAGHHSGKHPVRIPSTTTSQIRERGLNRPGNDCLSSPP